MKKILLVILIVISLILHASILRISPFSHINLILIITLVLIEKFDFQNSVFIFFSLIFYALIDPLKTMGIVLLQFSLTILLSELIFRVFSKRNLKLTNIGDLLTVMFIFYFIDSFLIFTNGGLSLDIIVNIFITFILNTILTGIVLSFVSVKRRDRLEMPSLLR